MNYTGPYTTLSVEEYNRMMGENKRLRQLADAALLCRTAWDAKADDYEARRALLEALDLWARTR